MAMASSEVTKSWIQWAVDLFADMQSTYQMYEDYYNGDHALVYATDRWEDAFGTTFEEFADNWCQVVVDAPADRLEIIGWRSNDKAIAEAAEKIWDESNVGDEEEELHLQTFIKGDGYLIVWPDPDGEPVEGGGREAQMFYNDALETNVMYDPGNKRRIERAAKKWEDIEGNIRLNLYYKDRIERYVVPAETSPAYTSGLIVPTEGQSLPQGWDKLENINNPHGVVPVFHFKNRGAGSTHGMSELKTVIPQQNAINKVLMDALLGSEFGGYRQMWMSGGGHPKEGWATGPNRLWATTDPNARFGQFDQTDLEHFVKLTEMLVGHVAKTTQTPMHYLRSSGDMPSGEAMKTAESGLVKKAYNRQKRWGNVWARAMVLAIKIRTGKDAKATDLQPVWRSPETRHDLEQAQVGQLKSILGVPLRRIWTEHFGYTEEECDEFEKMNKQIAATALAQLVASSGQVAPGASGTLADVLGVDPSMTLEGLDIPQVLALLGKGRTAETTAGEATVKPQANTGPPASPTRRSSGFKD